MKMKEEKSKKKRKHVLSFAFVWQNPVIMIVNECQPG